MVRCPFYEEESDDILVFQVFCENPEVIRTLICPFGIEYECDIPVHLKNLIIEKQ